MTQINAAVDAIKYLLNLKEILLLFEIKFLNNKAALGKVKNIEISLNDFTHKFLSDIEGRLDLQTNKLNELNLSSDFIKILSDISELDSDFAEHNSALFFETYQNNPQQILGSENLNNLSEAILEFNAERIA